MAGEHDIHKGLKNSILTILESSGFKVDAEIHISFSNSFSDDFSMDVCAIHEDHLILIECKKSDKDLSRQIEHTLANGSKINKITKILVPEACKITKKELEKIQHVHYCYAINDTEGKNENLNKKLMKNNIRFWNKEAIRYFSNTSKMLGHLTKYEILREMGIRDKAGSEPEDAVRLEQNGQEFFLLGIQPYKLLKMGYSFRRLSMRNESYQRILSGKKLEQLKEFYKNNKDFLLANTVLIAFEDEAEVQNEIDWNKNGDRKLHFPTAYCSAWIIDGQHRVYAFNNTKFSDGKKIESKKFKIPVVAFRTLAPEKQSRTFVNINYYQTKINTVLICDLASTFPTATYELTWVSLLVKELSKLDPWKGKIQTSQTDPKGTITIAGFIRPYFLTSLLGYNEKTEKYSGPLATLIPFNKKSIIKKGKGTSFAKQLEVLEKFFKSCKSNSWNSKNKTLMWDDSKYGLTGPAGVNALILVLAAILNKEKKIPSDFDKFTIVLKNMDFSKEHIKTLARGYGAYRNLAEEIVEKINQNLNENYEIKI